MMLPKLDARCEKCNGYGIEWNKTFDRAVDRVMDTQGLSFYDSVNQVRGNSMYEEDYSLCVPCNGTGKRK